MTLLERTTTSDGLQRRWLEAGTGEDHDIGVAAQAGHLQAWTDAVGVDQAVLAGHDLGGGVVQTGAVAAPERCAGLVAAATRSVVEQVAAPR